MRKIFISVNILLILFLSFFHYLINTEIYKFHINQQVKKMKSVVNIPYSLAENMEQQLRNNQKLKLTIIQEEFINLSQKLKYDNNEYFFIIDGKGNMVNHPLRPELSWWNMLFETDSEDLYIFRDFINEAKKEGEVYLTTNWFSKYNNEINEEQIIYGQYFWPWDWIICTTLYTNEINLDNSIMNKNTISTILIAYLLFNISLFLILRNRKIRGNINKVM